MTKPLRFFIAGIIQGSLPDAVHSQSYRREIADMLAAAFPGAEIFDPVEKYPDSLAYDAEKARAAFLDLMDLSGRHDVLIAFVPEASMGTAIELWNAHNAGSIVIAVSGLVQNWVVKFMSDRILPDLASLRNLIASGDLAKLIETRDAKARRLSGVHG